MQYRVVCLTRRVGPSDRGSARAVSVRVRDGEPRAGGPGSNGQTDARTDGRTEDEQTSIIYRFAGSMPAGIANTAPFRPSVSSSAAGARTDSHNALRRPSKRLFR